jgi:hypothetical protein
MHAGLADLVRCAKLPMLCDEKRGKPTYSYLASKLPIFLQPRDYISATSAAAQTAAPPAETEAELETAAPSSCAAETCRSELIFTRGAVRRDSRDARTAPTCL